MRDPYQILGLERTADEAAIKAAYRKLAKRHHPDLHPGDAKAGQAAFKKLCVQCHTIYGEGEGSEAFKAKLGESVLFPHRLGDPEELASMVVELVTNSYMNAEVVRVDGGIRMPPK